jgi:uncharacterized integral membrane protein
VADNDKAQHNRDTIRLGAAVVLFALLVAFVVDNTGKVNVGFVFFDKTTRLIYVLILTALIGVVLDRLWQRSRRH